jgi:hypothetical protein
VLINLTDARAGLPGAERRLAFGRRIHRLDQNAGGGGSIALTAVAEAHARLGNRAGLEAALAALATAYDGELTHVAAWSPFVRGIVPFLDGKLDVAWDVTREVLKGTAGENALSFAAFDRMNRIRWLQGSGPRQSATGLPSELEQNFPQLTTLRALHLAETGHRDEARALVVDLLDSNARRLHWNGGRPRTLHDLAETVGLLNDTRQAEALLPMIAPYDSEILCSYLITVDGAAATCLGILETVGDDLAAADLHFAAGLALEEQLGARLCAATTRVWWAHMLRKRDGAGDAERADLLVEDAVDTATRLGASRIVALHRRPDAGS